MNNALHISLKNNDDLSKLPKIVVMGIGGGGCNAINNMMKKKIDNVEFIAVNTDKQSLKYSTANEILQIGKTIAKGDGAGSSPELGQYAAQESEDEIKDLLEGTELLFLTAGMGGGTGTGATPYIAKIAKEMGILSVAVVTKPFRYEAHTRLKISEEGISELRKYVDTMIVLPNENLFRIANKDTTVEQAFAMSDNVLYLGVKGITDLITTPGLINLDFADVKMVIKKMGRAMMGMGEGEGENRAIKAVEEALSNPLLEDVNIKGATGVLVNITGSPDMTLFEFNDAAERIKEEIGIDEASIKIGMAFMQELEGKVRVSIFATGMDESLSYTSDRKYIEKEEEEYNQKIIDENKIIKNNKKEVEDLEIKKNNQENIIKKEEQPNISRKSKVLNNNNQYFDIGKQESEDNLDLDINKPVSLFDLFNPFSKDKEDTKNVKTKQNNSSIKIKNREIEIKDISNNNISNEDLNIPAYLRKNNN